MIIFIRILHGIGFGIHSTTSGAVIADIVPKSRLGEGLGYFGIYNTIAVATRRPGIALALSSAETG
jgi:MFS family permease